MKTGYDIVILAGQSNAEGNGRGPSAREWTPKENVLWMCDKHRIGYFPGEDGAVAFEAVLPVETEISVAKEREDGKGKIGNLIFSFAENYLKNDLAEGRTLLFVNAAVGGTGFVKNLWGVGEPLFERLCDMTKRALALPGENRTVAFLWHQGECDAFENPDSAPEERTAFYEKSLGAMLDGFRARFSCPEIPIVTGGFADEWRELFAQPCEAVYEAYRRLLAREPKMRFFDTKGLLSNNQKTQNGDNIHFCRESLGILGDAYYRLFSEIISQ